MPRPACPALCGPALRGSGPPCSAWPCPAWPCPAWPCLRGPALRGPALPWPGTTTRKKTKKYQRDQRTRETNGYRSLLFHSVMIACSLLTLTDSYSPLPRLLLASYWLLNFYLTFIWLYYLILTRLFLDFFLTFTWLWLDFISLWFYFDFTLIRLLFD